MNIFVYKNNLCLLMASIRKVIAKYNLIIIRKKSPLLWVCTTQWLFLNSSGGRSGGLETFIYFPYLFIFHLDKKNYKNYSKEVQQIIDKFNLFS